MSSQRGLRTQSPNPDPSAWNVCSCHSSFIHCVKFVLLCGVKCQGRTILHPQNTPFHQKHIIQHLSSSWLYSCCVCGGEHRGFCVHSCSVSCQLLRRSSEARHGCANIYYTWRGIVILGNIVNYIHAKVVKPPPITCCSEAQS